MNSKTTTKPFNIVIVVLLLSLFRTVTFAQKNTLKTIILNDRDGINEYVLGPGNVAIFEDTTGYAAGKQGSMTLDDIQSNKVQKQFKIFDKNYVPYNEHYGSTYWVKFIIRNESQFERSYIFESYSPHTEDFQLYIPRESGEYKVKQSGQKINFYKREYVNKNLALDLPVSTGNKEFVFYARVYDRNYSSFDFRFKTNNYFTFYSTNEYFLLGLFYGILIIMACYNLLLFISLKEKVYLYYILYILGGMLMTLTDDGLGYQYIWFNASKLNNVIGHHIAPIFMLVAFILYSRSFLQLEINFPKLDRLLRYVAIGFIGYYILEFTVLPEILKTRWLNLIPFTLIVYAAVKSFLSDYRPARFFMIGSFWILVSIIIINFRATGLIEGNIFTVYSLNYGLVIDVLLFSFALSERIKFIKVREEEAQSKIIDQLQENEKLKDKVNRELEEKVKERTIELGQANEALLDANEKLKSMTEKANEMSAKLDLDNWQLQKSNKESIKARIKDKEVTYEEFNKIFPDENACYKYLSEIKWSEGYTCRKCKHTKFMEGNKSYSRKCTRCAYPESATAYTLFHGLRFSIVKAFYLTYLTHRGDSKKTLRELSEILDLRRNTCWNFKKKVQETIDKHKAEGKRKVDNWEDIIFLY